MGETWYLSSGARHLMGEMQPLPSASHLVEGASPLPLWTSMTPF